MSNSRTPFGHNKVSGSPARKTIAAITAVSALLALSGILIGLSPAFAAEAPVGLGTAGSYSVLGGETVTNTGPTILNADLGVSAGTAITGFPPGIVGGAINAGNAEAAQAQSDLVIAYNDAAGRAPTGSIAGDLVGRTLDPGVYNSTGPIALSGTLTLDGKGDPSSVFIFQAASSLITASASNVSLIGGAQACNVFWQVGSSATLGTNSRFKGSILALTSIAVTSGTTVDGRALARNGEVTLDNNTFITLGCAAGPTTGVPTTGVPTTGVPTTGVPTTGVPTTDVATTGVPTTDVATTTGVPTTDVATTTGVPTTDVPTTSGTATETLGSTETATVSGGPGGAALARTGLARTGMEAVPIVLGALAILMLGVTALAATKVRRRH